MKKWICGLAGIVIGLSAGCNSELSFEGEVKKIEEYERGIRKVLKVNQEDSCNIFKDKNGKPYWILIENEKETKSIMYFDSDGDGKYDKKNTITIPKRLDILGIIPGPNDIPKKFERKKDYIPEKKFKKKDYQMLVRS